MSHTVLRGKPTAAQLYMDAVLNAILVEQGITPDPKQRENVTLTQIMYHCLKERPNDVNMTNGATGDNITNEQLLKHAISLSRAFIAKGAKGKYALMLMRNHQDMAAVYYAVMFSGLIPFMMDPNCTIHELTHFLQIIEPTYVFNDKEFNNDLQEALKGCKDINPELLTVDEPSVLKQFVEGYSDDVQSFKVAPASIDDPVMLLPTSGSTGLPKAAILSHRGIVAQLQSLWAYHTQFPTPTAKVMILTTIQWVSFTAVLTSCTAFHIPVLLTPKNVTVEHVTEMLEKYRPTWFFLGPAFANSLVPTLRTEQLSFVETFIVLGAPPAPELLDTLKQLLPKSAHLCDFYGSTETHGTIAIPDREAPLKSNGWVQNFYEYKIVNEKGQALGPGESGELYVKGPAVIKGYHKNLKAYEESFTPDGWYMTGDVFHVDENERISFGVKKKFTFKYKGSHVAPEEIERVINSVPGVHENVVVESKDGPAAAVVLLPNSTVTRKQINAELKNNLSYHKWLHGGIAFVTSLPHTHSGKLKRLECCDLVAELINNGECY